LYKSLLSYTYYRLGPLACSDLELTSATMNRFRHLGRTPWTGDLPTAKPLPTQNNTT